MKFLFLQNQRESVSVRYKYWLTNEHQAQLWRSDYRTSRMKILRPKLGGSSIVSSPEFVDHVDDLILSNQWISTKRAGDTLEIRKKCVGFTIHEQLGGQEEEDLNEKWQGMLQRGVQFLQNNAPAHRTCKMMDILKNLVFECTDHLLTRSCSIWLIPVIKTIKGFWKGGTSGMYQVLAEAT